MTPASSNSVTSFINFIGQVGDQIADVVTLVANNQIGAFLIGLYVLATLFHLVWGKVRRG